MKADVKGQGGQHWLYSEKVQDHFFNPRNLFTTDEEAEKFEEEADGIGEIGSPACGDVMRMYIKVKNNIVIDCKWKTFGCASAIASTSMLSVMVIGKTVEEAKKITPRDIVEALHGLPPRKIHCSVLGDQALRASIIDYEEKKL